jgi:hypothetical protein
MAIEQSQLLNFEPRAQLIAVCECVEQGLLPNVVRVV